MFPVLPKLNTFRNLHYRAYLLNSPVKCDHCRYWFCMYPTCACGFPVSVAWSGVCSYKGNCDGDQLEISLAIVIMCVWTCVQVEKQSTLTDIPIFGGEMPWSHNVIMENLTVLILPNPIHAPKSQMKKEKPVKGLMPIGVTSSAAG